MPLPNFLVIGTAKAGTTSLARYLSLHPDVCFSSVKEPNYFAYDHEYARGQTYYESLYAHYAGEKRLGEKSWRYTLSEVYPEAFDRVTRLLPDLKLIYMLRDPLPRALSMWREQRDAGQDPVPDNPDDALLYDPIIRDSCRYGSAYRRFAGHYGAENVRILFFEDMKTDPAAFYAEVTRFLEIAPFQPDAAIHENKSVGQRSDGALLSAMRRAGLDGGARALIPSGLRRMARTYLRKEIRDVTIRDETRRAFLDFVEPEVRWILDHTGRPRDFWIRPD